MQHAVSRLGKRTPTTSSTKGNFLPLGKSPSIPRRTNRGAIPPASPPLTKREVARKPNAQVNAADKVLNLGMTPPDDIPSFMECHVPKFLIWCISAIRRNRVKTCESSPEKPLPTHSFEIAASTLDFFSHSIIRGHLKGDLLQKVFDAISRNVFHPQFPIENPHLRLYLVQFFTSAGQVADLNLERMQKICAFLNDSDLSYEALESLDSMPAEWKHPCFPLYIRFISAGELTDQDLELITTQLVSCLNSSIYEDAIRLCQHMEYCGCMKDSWLSSGLEAMAEGQKQPSVYDDSSDRSEIIAEGQKQPIAKYVDVKLAIDRMLVHNICSPEVGQTIFKITHAWWQAEASQTIRGKTLPPHEGHKRILDVWTRLVNNNWLCQESMKAIQHTLLLTPEVFHYNDGTPAMTLIRELALKKSLTPEFVMFVSQKENVTDFKESRLERYTHADFYNMTVAMSVSGYKVSLERPVSVSISDILESYERLIDAGRFDTPGCKNNSIDGLLSELSKLLKERKGLHYSHGVAFVFWALMKRNILEKKHYQVIYSCAMDMIKENGKIIPAAIYRPRLLSELAKRGCFGKITATATLSIPGIEERSSSHVTQLGNPDEAYIIGDDDLTHNEMEVVRSASKMACTFVEHGLLSSGYCGILRQQIAEVMLTDKDPLRMIEGLKMLASMIKGKSVKLDDIDFILDPGNMKYLAQELVGQHIWQWPESSRREFLDAISTIVPHLKDPQNHKYLRAIAAPLLKERVGRKWIWEATPHQRWALCQFMEFVPKFPEGQDRESKLIQELEFMAKESKKFHRDFLFSAVRYFHQQGVPIKSKDLFQLLFNAIGRVDEQNFFSFAQWMLAKNLMSKNIAAEIIGCATELVSTTYEESTEESVVDILSKILLSDPSMFDNIQHLKSGNPRVLGMVKKQTLFSAKGQQVKDIMLQFHKEWKEEEEWREKLSSLRVFAQIINNDGLRHFSKNFPAQLPEEEAKKLIEFLQAMNQTDVRFCIKKPESFFAISVDIILKLFKTFNKS